tara:strand:- start:16660 stop:17604 length:945 start_codon:yes stop_codon:yes gene_type:complete
MSSWSIKSIPPHDWFICLDIDSYFDHEHNPEKIFEEGFTRPIPLKDRDVILTVFFNGDSEKPEFHVETPEKLSKDEIQQANSVLARILGTNIDLRTFYDQASGDPVLAPKMNEFYGLKRMARANLFDDIVNRIIQMRLSHKPTAKKMVYKVRETYGTHLEHSGTRIPAWPRPIQLAAADPAQIRKLGPTVRKGEYIIGLSHSILSNEIDPDYLDHDAGPQEFYDRISGVRGIGPTSAQDLMLFRERTDAVFPSTTQKGEEKGLRKWILLSYGIDPNNTSEKKFQQCIKHWKGYEAAAIEFLFVNWMIEQKKKKQ